MYLGKNENLIEDELLNEKNEENECEKKYSQEKLSDLYTNHNLHESEKKLDIVVEKDYQIKIDKDFDYDNIKSELEKCDTNSPSMRQNNHKKSIVQDYIHPCDENLLLSNPAEDFLDMQSKTKRNKQIDLQKFFKKSRHYFIMSEGGQPIYTRYGDELQNCELLATFSAIIAKFTHFHNTSTTKEKLHYIKTEKTLIVFLKKGHMIFMALSKKNDTISLLISQLEYLYLQLVAIITADRLTRLEDNPRSIYNALSDTNELFEQIITYTTHSMASLLNSFQILVMDSNARNKLCNICSEKRGEALLCIILTPYEIVAISKSEMIGSVIAHDIILIQNLIFSSESLKQTESWVPVCLPGISDCGYLQMYTNFFEPNFGIVFVTESQEHSYFLKFAEQSRDIYQAALDENIVTNIKFAFSHKNKSSNFSTSKKPSFDVLDDEDKFVEVFLKKIAGTANGADAPNLQKRNSVVINYLTDPFESAKFLICKNKVTSQFFTFRFDNFNHLNKNAKGVMKYYSVLYDIYNSQNVSINLNNFFYFEKSEDMTHIIHTNENYILFASFSLFDEYDTIHNISSEILKIIKYKESNFFINKY